MRPNLCPKLAPLLLVLLPLAAPAQSRVDIESVVRGSGFKPGGGVSFMSGRYLPPVGGDKPVGVPFLKPLDGGEAEPESLLSLSAVPETEIDPDKTVTRWLGTPITLEDSRESVNLFHHTVIADQHVINGDPVAALDHLDSALQQDPLNQSILERAARAAEMAGQNARSRLYWDVLANLDTQSAEIQYQRILSLCRDSFWDDARNHLDGNLETYPQHPGLRLLSALFAEDHGVSGLGLLTLPDMAALLRELHLRRNVLSSAFPKNYGPVTRLVLLGGVEAASTNLTAVADNSYWARTAALAQRYLVDAELAMRGGKAARMLESLDAAGKVGVDGPWLRLYRAQGWMDSGRMDEGARALQLVVDGYGDKAEIALRAGRILLDIERPAAALLLFTRAVELERDNPEYRFALACANIAQGNVQAAMTQYRWVKDNHPDLASTWIKGDEPYLRLLRERVRP